jgi:chromosome partitioning protein
MGIILCGAIKGGVGKTTLASNLSVWIGQQKKSVCLIDADTQGSLTEWCLDREEAGHTPKIPWYAHTDGLYQEAIELSEKYEVVIIDCGGRDNPAFRQALLSADLALFPVRPPISDLRTMPRLSSLVQEAEQVRKTSLPAYGILSQCPTHSKSQDIPLARDWMKQECSSIPILKSVTKNKVGWQRATEIGKGVTDVGKNNCKGEFQTLAQEIWGIFESLEEN